MITLTGLEVRVSYFLPPQRMVSAGHVLFVRHMTEFYHWVAGAVWHTTPERCPTWTDAAECQCMRGGEA